ncbi:hypothetical protein [Duganella qianjiadongensis]|uniref:Uncharacterized protein n=1 Tax=Duganella qianjiadongensis TaxID=2692176 RepID=A0ABW9VKG7_9BURK|nr:hypothetical protein [Duganella qianjiadongensis]MYM39145.1 hypothetical protein [Duganella qianjiadongensis]
MSTKMVKNRSNLVRHPYLPRERLSESQIGEENMVIGVNDAPIWCNGEFVMQM